jgi:hypothetical protein
MPYNPPRPAAHATPTELRERARLRMEKWRELIHVDARAAREHMDVAVNLTELADEAEGAAAKHNLPVTLGAQLGRQGE